jgi:hypothetical protein
MLVAGRLEVIVALAVAGAATALYSAVRRHSPGAALGYAGLGTMVAATLLAGVVTVLSLATLRRQCADADAAEPGQRPASSGRR